MADLLQVVITEDGSGYYLSQGEHESEESTEWGLPLEFNGVSYLADCSENGEDVSLSKVVEIPSNGFEVVSEGDDSDDEDDEDSEDQEEGVEIGVE